MRYPGRDSNPQIAVPKTAAYSIRLPGQNMDTARFELATVSLQGFCSPVRATCPNSGWALPKPSLWLTTVSTLKTYPLAYL